MKTMCSAAIDALDAKYQEQQKKLDACRPTSEHQEEIHNICMEQRDIIKKMEEVMENQQSTGGDK
jgi:hypothetical protein